MTNVIIIGGGLGGLFTGALLAKNGVHVTVLEKNTTAGGGLQSFHRFGVSFDTGMHVISGMQPGGSIRRICQYLGIADKVDIMDVDDDCTDSLYFAEDHCTYRIRKGKVGFVDSLAEHFPHERENLQAYVNAVFAIAESIDLFSLRPSSELFPQRSEDFLMAADAFVAKYIKDPRLRSVVSYMNPLYGGRQDETPAFVHAIISTLYIQGASRFVGGSSKFADLLVSVIEQNEGKVLTHEAVEWIDVDEERSVQWVRTQSGNKYNADWYISAIHPCTLFGLMPENAFPKAYRNRLNSIPNSYSAFSAYIKLKPNTFPYINHSEYYMTRYDKIWQFGEKHDQWPLGFLFMTPPVEQQGEYAQTVLLTAPMLFSETAQWENTKVGHRGADYEAWKEQRTHDLLVAIEEMHPGFSECIDKINNASPLTIRDFYGVKDGSLCGFSKDYKNLTLSQVPIATKVKNLLLTGQNNNLHGFCGVPLTAITTAEAILGRNHILDKLNKN
jgi:all-trans-retinol 13,14-reductase